jgi:CheY-like chemotaxis protein
MKILIVDDEPLVRKSLGRAFKAKGHDVVEAIDGTEGLQLWTEMLRSSRSPDIVLVDVLMPGLSGPELLQTVQRTAQPNLEGWRSQGGRVIMMSAYSGEHNVTTAQQLGADLFVPKPFDDVFALVKIAEDLFGQR